MSAVWVAVWAPPCNPHWLITFTKQAALDKDGSHLSEMRNHSCYEWSQVCVYACVCVCAAAADNEEIISTLSCSFPLSLFPTEPGPSCPLPDILQCFSHYFAFVSEHLFLAPLPPALFAQEREKNGERISENMCVCDCKRKKQELPRMFVLFVVSYCALIHSCILPLLFKGRL